MDIDKPLDEIIRAQKKKATAKKPAAAAGRGGGRGAGTAKRGRGAIGKAAAAKVRPPVVYGCIF